MNFFITTVLGNRQMIIKQPEHTWIPMDEQNSDYQQYLSWVAEGNTAEEWQPE